MKLSRYLAVLAAAVYFLNPIDAFAHEKRNVAGKYDFVVGFLNEPAFSGAMNGIDLRISEGNKPVEGLEQALRAKVYFGDSQTSFPLALKKRYKQPGNYAGYFYPTKPGKYTFVIEGVIEGDAIREVFASGPGTFGDVQDSENLKFP